MPLQKKILSSCCEALHVPVFQFFLCLIQFFLRLFDYYSFLNQGMMGVTISSEFGGSDMDSLSYAIAMEEISRGCASTGVVMSVNNSLYCGPVNYFGTTDQKTRFLTPCASGGIPAALTHSLNLQLIWRVCMPLALCVPRHSLSPNMHSG